MTCHQYDTLLALYYLIIDLVHLPKFDHRRKSIIGIKMEIHNQSKEETFKEMNQTKKDDS